MNTASDVLAFLHRTGGGRSTARVVAEMLRFLTHAYELERASFFLADREDGGLRAFASEFRSGAADPQLFDEWRTLDIEATDLGRRIRAGEDLVRLDRGDDPGGLPPAVAARYGMGALVALAVRHGGHLDGMLVLEAPPERLAFGTTEIVTLVSHLALALDNARAVEREQHRSAEAEALLEVTGVLARTTRLTAVLAAVAQNAAKVAGFERCSIFLVDEAEHRILPTMSQFADGHAEPEAWELFTSTDADLPVVWEILREGRPRAFERPQDHPDLIPPIWYQPYGVASVAYLPLEAWGERFGVLELDHRQPATISPRELRIAQAVAAQGAIAISIGRTLDREQQAIEDLEAAHRAKDDFLAMLSHELRTPLAAVRGFAETLELHDDRLEPEQRRDLLARIRAGAERQQRLIDDLLHTTRMAHGTLEVRAAEVELRTALEEVLAGLRAQDEHAADHLTTELDVPALHRVVVDPDHLRQIVGNLVGNARKYGRAPVVITSERREGDIRLSVRDHGDGVAPSFVAALFEPFTQASSEGPTVDGVGLGLSIARRLARANGGELAYTSPPGGGACFVVDLPTASSGDPEGSSG
ncbi:MAG: GAF domain-containing protein [Actinobacteria bacterium]|nr:GAF domain-containing protein [Actinomycetota bacterium]